MVWIMYSVFLSTVSKYRRRGGNRCKRAIYCLFRNAMVCQISGRSGCTMVKMMIITRVSANFSRLNTCMLFSYKNTWRKTHYGLAYMKVKGCELFNANHPSDELKMGSIASRNRLVKENEDRVEGSREWILPRLILWEPAKEKKHDDNTGTLIFSRCRCSVFSVSWISKQTTALRI